MFTTDIPKELLALLYARAALDIPVDRVPAGVDLPTRAVETAPSPDAAEWWHRQWTAWLAYVQSHPLESPPPPNWRSLPGSDAIDRELIGSWIRTHVEQTQARAQAVLGISTQAPAVREALDHGVCELVVLPLAESWWHRVSLGRLAMSTVTLEDPSFVLDGA